MKTTRSPAAPVHPKKETIDYLNALFLRIPLDLSLNSQLARLLQ